MMPNGMCSSLDLQGHLQGNNQQTPFGDREGVVHPRHVTDANSFRGSSIQAFLPPFPSLESKAAERLSNYVGDGISPKAVEGKVDKNFDGGRGKEGIIWHRTKWTDEMVKVLITALSYVGEDGSALCSNSEGRKLLLCPRKGKWRTISDVMVERGYYVSPQQCEDKFNDLNKKYKRLNAILGKGNACKVVENPVLMESIDLSDEAKEEAKKILSCKQLFYEEMCSFHNGNSLSLPNDQVLQKSLLFSLKGKDNYESERLVQGMPAKRMRLGEEHEVLRLASPSNYKDLNTSSDSHAPNGHTSLIDINTTGGEGAKLRGEQLTSRSLKLEEEKLKLQAQMLELEKERFEWLRYRHQKDRELQKMRLKIELMKLENERLAYELKRKANGANDN